MKSAKLILVLLSIIFANCAKTEIVESSNEIVIENTNKVSEIKQTKPESAEEKAVRIAEEFIKRNGYTDAPADKNNLSHETVEFYDNIDERLKQRYNTLNEKAFGVSAHGRGNEKGWTVVFQYAEKVVKEIEKIPKTNLVSNPKIAGRAVTMNENFENLLVEHKDFFLDKAEKKLR